MELILSEKQVETLEDFFSGNYRDLLYGGGARGGKSWLIGVLLAICVASMPGSTWLIARTVLSDLKGTTLATFFQVLSKLGFGPKSYKDKIRDEKTLHFANKSKVIVMQVNNEPSDPEFDRLGSYSLTGAFLDEGQQMVAKIRSVLKGRFSETSGDFKFEVDKPTEGTIDTKNIGYSIKIKVVGQAELDKDDLNCEGIKEIIREGKHFCAIVDYYDLFIPYKIVETEDKGNKLLLTAVWEFKAITLISCNPGKNFTYTDFYKPYAKGLIEGDGQKYMGKKKFIRALVTDNPFVDDAYVSGLEDADEVTKQRLLYGNFEYDDDPTLLFNIDMLNSMFEGQVDSGQKYLTIDAARMGKDSTAIGLWNGLTLLKITTIAKMKLTKQAEIIQKMMDDNRITVDHVIVDEVGVGGGLVDLLGCKGFIANASPMQPYAAKLLVYKKRNYANLRTQAFFYLQKYVGEGLVKIKCNPTEKEIILEELGFVRQNNVDDDGKISLESKKDMKAFLGRSPDIGDCFIGTTKILTDKGEVYIKDMKVGDFVITPYGKRKVLKLHKRYENNKLLLLNNKLLGTSNHKIYTKNGFKTLDTITFRDRIETYSLLNLLKWRLKRLLNITKRNIGFREQANISTQTNMNEVSVLRKHYIETYGKNTMEEYKNDSIYTILTEILSIMKLKISLRFTEGLTYLNIGKKSGKNPNIEEEITNISKRLEIRHQNGINQKNEGNGTKKIIKNDLLSLKLLKNYARIAEKDIVTLEGSKDFVGVYALNDSRETLEGITKHEFVGYVNPNTRQTNTGKQKPVQEVVLQRGDTEGSQVYDLEIEGDNCYYANGILVSNCISFRMWWIIKNHHDGTLDEADEVTKQDPEDTNANFIQGLIDELEDKNVKTDFEPDLEVY